MYPKDDGDEKNERKYNYIISFLLVGCCLSPSLHHSDLTLTEWFEDGFNLLSQPSIIPSSPESNGAQKLDDGQTFKFLQDFFSDNLILHT